MRIVLILIALTGVVVSGVLLRMSLPSAGPVSLFGEALCAPSQRVNCDYVLASRWSKIGPIPSAAWGMSYFAALAVWYVFVGIPNREGRRWHLIPLSVNAAGALASAWFVLVMAVFLPVWCTWCMAAHVVNGLLLVGGLLAWPRSPRVVADAAPAAYPSAVRALGVTGGCLALALVVTSCAFGYQMQLVARQFQLAHLEATNNADYVLWRFSRSGRQDIDIRADDLTIGRADASHTLVVFGDFECVNCAGFHRYAARLTNLFPDAVRCVFKHYPLCRDCNPHVEVSPHVFACEAAQAAEAARRISGLREAYLYQQKLYENAWRFDRRPYEALAREAGLDAMKWREAFEAADAGAKIADDIEQAHRLGVEATPSIFLDGRRLEAWHLLSTDAQPKVDLAATDRLWEALLDAAATSRAAQK